MEHTVKRWVLTGIPVISIVGCLMHFVYEWSGGLAVIGLIAPVNESVWEHLKLIFWPLLIWWIIGYIHVSKKEELDPGAWFFSGAVGLYAGPLFITAFYYTYTGAIGIHTLFLDVLSFILGTAASQLSALHIYRHAAPGRSVFLLTAAAVVLLGAAFLLFTFSPPKIPLFENPITGSYGI